MSARHDRPPLLVAGAEVAGGTRRELRLSVPGSEEALPALVLCGARPGRTLLVIVGLGDAEHAGVAAARELAARLDPAALRGALLVVPAAAPAPGAVRAVAAALLGAADALLELRGAPRGAVAYAHAEVDVDHAPSRRLARRTGAEVVLHRPPPPGSLARRARRAGLPAVLFEVGEAGRRDRAARERGASATAGVLDALRILPGPPPAPPFQVILRATERTIARVAGLVELVAEPGDLVYAGELLAAIRTSAAAERIVLAARSAGIVLSATAAEAVTADGVVVELGRVRKTLGRIERARAAARAGATSDQALALRRAIGWCEWVALPDLGLAALEAKIDTGARTCALHVSQMRPAGSSPGPDGAPRAIVEIDVPLGGGRIHRARAVVEDFVVVRDSGGHAERRPVTTTTLALGPVRKLVRVTLTNRGDMLFPMLIGRTALGRDFLVDAAARHRLGGRPTRGDRPG